MLFLESSSSPATSMHSSLPFMMEVLALVLLGSIGTKGGQGVVDRDLEGDIGGRLGGWGERRRHGRAPPDDDEGGGWNNEKTPIFLKSTQRPWLVALQKRQQEAKLQNRQQEGNRRQFLRPPPPPRGAILSFFLSQGHFPLKFLPKFLRLPPTDINPH